MPLCNKWAPCFYKQQLLYPWQYKLAPSKLLFLIQQLVLRWTGKKQMLLIKKVEVLNWHTVILI